MDKYEKAILKSIEDETSIPELKKYFPELSDSRLRQLVWNLVDKGVLAFSINRKFVKK